MFEPLCAPVHQVEHYVVIAALCSPGTRKG